MFDPNKENEKKNFQNQNLGLGSFGINQIASSNTSSNNPFGSLESNKDNSLGSLSNSNSNNQFDSQIQNPLDILNKKNLIN